MKIIKFSAGWCKPCKRLDTVLGTMDLPCPVEIVDIDQEPGRASDAAVRGVPTLVLVNAEGAEQKRLTGLKTAAQIQEWLDE